MFRPSRKRREGEDRFLAWKVQLFLIGAAAAFAGMAMSLSWLVWVGIAVLLVAMVLRFLNVRD
ncbi:MAG: hypothetical protein F4139_12515 [Gemmatimonadetes bacterium]|nr:hypothetical protein [Gemmatimonadota bacterium]MYA63908.1 hypothetical protein [Gemmatimonadota bacterium]MYB99131.1 hypothetical protein [Gemmatimonadota bacterium]MYH53744.1 hypothetical protein [Gemmatimonadota bacterium]MYI46979.1 hypothetical protein [Gemmatimonadota bacterium]